MTKHQIVRAALSALVLSVSVSAADAPTAVLDSGHILTLDEAVRLALENNPDIKVEAYAPIIAQANVLSAYGQFDPAINFNRSYSRSFSYPPVPAPLPPLLAELDSYSLTLNGSLPTGLIYSIGGSADNERGPFNNYAGDYLTFGGVNLTQPLLRGFGLSANLVNIRVARANRSISKWQYRQTLIDTVTEVIVTYNQLLLARDNLRIARRYRELGETLLTESQQRLKAGSGAKSDVITARAQVASREEGVLETENTVRSTDNQLRELIGERSFPKGRALLLVIVPPVPPVNVDPAQDYEQALNLRPDYQAALLGITINRANAAAASNSLLPQLNLVGSYGYNGLASTFAASRQMVSDRNAPSSSIGINVSIPITNAVARGRARAARLTFEQSEAQLRDLEAQIAVAIANSASQIETAHLRVIADQTAYDLANQALVDEEKKLQAGNSSTLAVIQDQQILVGDENSLASARYAEHQAVALYDQQLGTTLSQNHISLADNM